MKELNNNEIQEVNGGVIPLLYTVYYAAQYATIRWGAGRIAAAGAGAIAGYLENN